MSATTVARTGTFAERLYAQKGSRRKTVDRVARSIAMLATVTCTIPLAAVLIYVVIKGLPAISVEFLTEPSKALGVGGGALQAWLGPSSSWASRRSWRFQLACLPASSSASSRGTGPPVRCASPPRSWSACLRS